jgi:peptidyl-Asp metalloendopeptidase
MKKILLLLLLVVAGVVSQAQRNLFIELADDAMGRLSENEAHIRNQYLTSKLVIDLRYIRVDVAALNEASILIQTDKAKTIASRVSTEQHDNDDGISWFGRLSDETGIFFTAINGQVASKFYLEATPYLIIPFRGDVHLLIAFSHEVDNGICGTPHGDGKMTMPGKNLPGKTRDETGFAAGRSADDNCTMRVLWIVTAQAEPEITMNLDLAARMLQDETNLAYQQSIINYRMEIARVERTTYAETTAYTSASAYGTTFSFPSDLINLSTGAGLLSTVPTLRNLYQADVVVMVRSLATNTAQGIYGVAYGVPNDPSLLNANNAFALISTEYMIGGRFTFAHEIGHIQGARHDNNPGTPVYALGYVFSGSGITNRTIMAVGGSCNPPTGCRVQFFSNPNVSFLGTPIGIVNARDNARRINETALQIKAHRITSTTLLLGAETFNNEILARHLATQTISTNNNAVVALSGSRVSMRAGNSVSLLPGFVANSGSVFTAYINNCTYVPTVDRTSPSGDVVAQVRSDKSFATEMSGSAFAIAPNPTRGTVNITAGNGSLLNTMLVLINQSGVLLQQQFVSTTAKQVAFDLGKYPTGMYLLKIVDGKGVVHVKKIVKE